MTYATPDYNTYLMRHGESALQALVEHMERYEGIKPGTGSLEKRWIAVMTMHDQQEKVAA